MIKSILALAVVFAAALLSPAISLAAPSGNIAPARAADASAAGYCADTEEQAVQ